MDPFQCILDQSRYVPPNFKPLVDWKCCVGCRERPFPRPRIDYTRQFFCCKWGPSFRCLCPQECEHPCGPPHVFGPSQFRGVGDDVESFNYFSPLPIRPESTGRFPGCIENPRTLQEQEGMIIPDPCPKYTLGYTPSCDLNGGQIRPDIFKGDSICGACGPKPYSSGDGFECEKPEIFDFSCPNFRVYQADWPKPKEIKLRTGAERCLQPSRYRDINSVYRASFKDFMKMKTKKEIELYRCPMAVDNRRPKVTICREAADLCIGVNNGPVEVQGRWLESLPKCPKRRRPCCLPEPPDFRVFVPPEIVIPGDYIGNCSELCKDSQGDGRTYKGPSFTTTTAQLGSTGA